MASSSSLVSGTGILCPHRPVIKHPSFVSVLCPLPTSTLSGAGWHLPPEFYLKCNVLSKSHTSETPAASAHTDSLGESLAEQWMGASFPRKHLCDHTATEVQRLCQTQHTANTRFYNTLASLSQYQQTGCSLGSTGTFACGEGIWPLLNALQAEELLLPVWHMDPSDPTACFWGFTLFPHQSTTRHRAPDFLTLLSTVYRILVVLRPSPFSLPVVLGNRFLIQSPASVFTLFLSFSAANFGKLFFLYFPDVPHSPLSLSFLCYNSSLPLVASLSHNSLLCTAYLLSFVAQVIQIVVLILRSIC
ncbi:uncharacterized protein LOC125936195 [Panthera uncia]|uniref:uncharacterized protein LOC125936195 n=1 Tax=Panthera uncia TaxID=29064 RepID=UPI0020FFC671|nr:uncharacterized protein LOC125936195 [Panthera uncia]